MKKIQLVAVGMLLLTTAFTSCKKESYDASMASPNTSTPGARVIENNATVTFTAGYINSSHFAVRDYQHPLFEFLEPRNLDMFTSMQKMALPMPPDNYRGLVTNIEAGPSNNMSSLMLVGVLTSSDATGNPHPSIPVTLIMNKPISIVANTEQLTVNDETMLPSLLNVRLDQITTGITPDMWKNAMDYIAGTITISETQNPDLYNMILKNLNTMVRLTVSTTNNAPKQNTAAQREPEAVIMP